MRMNAKAMRQVQQLQERLLKAQDALAEEKIEVSVGGGVVRVVMNGQQELEEITIDPEVVDPDDVEMLQDLIIAAINEATNRARDLAQDSMGSLLGGLGLGGLF